MEGMCRSLERTGKLLLLILARSEWARHFDHPECFGQLIQSGIALPDVKVVTLPLRTPESCIKVTRIARTPFPQAIYL
jgi:hypothetical protein